MYFAESHKLPEWKYVHTYKQLQELTIPADEHWQIIWLPWSGGPRPKDWRKTYNYALTISGMLHNLSFINVERFEDTF